jgi:hypothetical protein
VSWSSFKWFNKRRLIDGVSSGMLMILAVDAKKEKRLYLRAEHHKATFAHISWREIAPEDTTKKSFNPILYKKQN